MEGAKGVIRSCCSFSLKELDWVIHDSFKNHMTFLFVFSPYTSFCIWADHFFGSVLLIKSIWNGMLVLASLAAYLSILLFYFVSVCRCSRWKEIEVIWSYSQNPWLLAGFGGEWLSKKETIDSLLHRKLLKTECCCCLFFKILVMMVKVGKLHWKISVITFLSNFELWILYLSNLNFVCSIAAHLLCKLMTSVIFAFLDQ